jgi:hypothetical protein
MITAQQSWSMLLEAERADRGIRGDEPIPGYAMGMWGITKANLGEVDLPDGRTVRTKEARAYLEQHHPNDKPA